MHCTRPSKRSKGGCWTCKERKLKCDLARPVCRNCGAARKQRECVYDPRPPPSQFLDLKRWPLQDPGDKAHSMVVPTPSSPPEPAPLHVFPARPQVTRRGYDAFEYYLDCVVPANAELQGGTDFWKIMAQLHDQEPSMMYLIQAYGTLNRAWWNQHDISLRVFFFESLSRGLHAFHRRSQLYQDEVFVFAALLLAALEELREMDVRAGRAHVHAAAQIIESWPQDPDAWPIHTRNLRHFLRTAIAPGIMVTKMKISLADRSFRALPSVPKVAPSVGGLSYGTETYFVDALDAAGELHEIITFWVCPLVCGQRHAWVGMLDPRSVQGLLDTWHESFACLEHSSPASPLEIATRKLTKANYYAAQAGVAGARAQWTTASVERLAHIFTDTLELIEDFFEQRLSEKETAQATSLLGLIPPLFLVATCARESRVKQRAVALLQEHDRREGAWTARVAALVAGVVMTYQRHSQLRSTAARPAVQPWYQASRVVSLSHGTAAPAELYVYLYDISRSEKSEEVCKAAFTDQEKQLCRDVEWPLHATIRSFGFYPTNRFPTPLMQATPRNIRRGR